MEKIITGENLRSFAYVNENICKKPIRGIVIEFMGLGMKGMYDEDIDVGRFFAEQGILFVVPYTNPWSWMNRQAIAYVDEIVDILIEKYGLPDNIPISSTGGSMGGQCALIYTLYAKRTPVGCVANCPVCDMPYHYTERSDLPRTMYSAFFEEKGNIGDVLARYSPLHVADRLPDVEYYIFHCTADTAVNREKHSERLVEKLRALGRRVTYTPVPNRRHCDLGPEFHPIYLKNSVDLILANC